MTLQDWDSKLNVGDIGVALALIDVCSVPQYILTCSLSETTLQARHRGSPQLFTCSGWQQTKAELRQVLEWEFGAYWDRARAAAARGNSAGKQQDGQPCGQPGGQQDGQQDEAAGEQPVLRLAEVHQVRCGAGGGGYTAVRSGGRR